MHSSIIIHNNIQLSWENLFSRHVEREDHELCPEKCIQLVIGFNCFVGIKVTVGNEDR